MKGDSMKKIRNKILKSYMLIVVAVIMIVAVIFSLLSQRYLINETRRELRNESKIIANLLKTEKLNTLSQNDMVLQRRLSVAGRTIDSNLLVLDKNNTVVYESIKPQDRRIIEKYKEKKTVTEQYLAEKYDIYNQKGEYKGNVVLFIRLKFAEDIRDIFTKSLIISIVAGVGISMILGLLLSNSITNPVRKLRKKMEDISFDEDHLTPSIRTKDEIEDLEKTFISMAKKLKHKEELQKAFFQNSSHELKTPLMSIQGYAEAIKDGIVEGEEMDESLDIIVSESKRLKEIVDEIMYLGSLERDEQKLELSNEKLNEVIDWAIDSVNPLASSNGIAIRNNIQKTIVGLIDSQKMHRAFLNILGNAVRYAKTHIDIDAGLKGKTIVITISDDGPGFSGNEEEVIFERFYKGKKGSSGLGLAITKAIIQLHGGDIRAYNNSINGASIEISLPII